MADMLKNLPIEERFVEHESEGKVVLIPALNKTWVKLSEKNFIRYISHPDPGHKNFVADRLVWLEIIHFVIEDLEWLLRQEHHIFWSHMIFSMEAQWLILTFLQEAPPYYMRSEFPKDEEMEHYFAKAEHLVFLVLRRLATRMESPEHHIKNFGDLLYNSYLFTIPMFFDIFLIYGYNNRELVGKLFYDVVTASPKYLHDLGVVPHFFLKILQMVKEKFDIGTVAIMNEKHKLRPDFAKNVFLHLVDTTANMQIFFDINMKFAKCMRAETFLSEIAFFYGYVIPKINAYIKKDTSCEPLKEKLDFIRLNLLSVVRSIFCCTVNDVVNDERNREENANEYLTRLMDLMQEPLFLSDYNKVYPIDNDLRMLRDLCPNLDTINLKYISDAVAACSITKYKTDQLREFRLSTLISEVRDVLPHLGDGFVEFCLRFYDFDTAKVVTAIIEDTLPSSLDKLDRNMQRPNQNEQKTIIARINAEKQYRMDRAGTSGVKIAQNAPGTSGIGKQKMDKPGTSGESEQKMDKPGTSGKGKQKMDKPGTSGEDEGMRNRPGTSGESEQKMDKPGRNGKGKQKMDKPGTSGEVEQKMDKPGTNGEIEQKMDKPGTSGESEQKMDKPGRNGKGKQKMDKPGTSGETEHKTDAPGTSGKGKQKMDKPETSGKGKQKMDRPGTSGESEQKMDRPGTSGESEQKMDKPGRNGKGKQKMDKPGTSVEGEENRPGTSGKGKQRMDKPETSGKGKQRMDKPETSGKGKQKMDKPGTSGESEQKTDAPGTSGKGKQKKDKPGTSAEDEGMRNRPGTSGESQAKNEKGGTRKAPHQDIIEFFSDKLDLMQLKSKVLNYARTTEIYDDEYDDTYDGKSLLVKEGRNVEEDKKSVVKRKVVATRDGEIEDKSSEEEAADSPENIRDRLLQRRMDKLRRDFIAVKKVQIQERELLMSRRFKDAHKSSVANHNRKKLSSKKRNMGWGNA